MSPFALLAAIMPRVTDTVVECGCGYGSTPVLFAACRSRNIPFLSLEESPEWAERIATAMGGACQPEWCESIPDRLVTLGHAVPIGMVLVDNGSYRVKPNIERSRVLAVCRRLRVPIIAVHDTESDTYGFAESLAGWKQRVDWDGSPLDDGVASTVVSDVRDLSWLRECLAGTTMEVAG
ncbi:MAG: hypothetical protein GY851_35665 [bacterium]|nr:hypothetical protein [bacterium]